MFPTRDEKSIALAHAHIANGDRASRFPTLVLWCLLVIALFCVPPGNVLSWDALGYYLYLPAFFIHHDPLLLDQEWLRHALDTYNGLGGGGFYQAHQLENGNWVMKYTMGLAVLWSPFVTVAHLLAPILGYPADGFSRPYQVAVIVAEMVYALIGLLALRAVLARWWSSRVVSFTLLLVVLGTNYLHQALFANSMPHIFLFTLQVGTLYATMRWYDTRRRRYATMLAICIGVAALSRPTEVVLLLIPLFWGHSGGIRDLPRFLWQRIRDDMTPLLGMVTIMVLIGSAQLLYWKYATGHFVHMSYTGDEEGFDFLRPYTLQALFSFRKGWFIYTPMMLVAVLGIIRLKGREMRTAVIAFVVLNTYIVTSWSNWWYSESFGHRGLMQSIAIMAVPLAAIVDSIARKAAALRFSVAVVLAALTGLNLFQTWQSHMGIIPGSRMSLSYYTAVFGRTDGIPDGDLRMLVDRSAPPPSELHEDAGHHLTRSAWITADQAVADAGENDLSQVPPIGVLQGGEAFSQALRLPFNDITTENHLWMRVRCKVDTANAEANGSIVVTMDHGGTLYGYKAYDVHRATMIDAIYLTPELRGHDDEVNIYYWHRGGTVGLGPILVDFYEPVVPAPL
jgi:hypothetical protein